MALYLQNAETPEFAQQVRINQQNLADNLKPRYDFIVCGSGPSGSVVARRLAENTEVSILLLEAGGSDDVSAVMEASQWTSNLGSEREWGFQTRPNSNLNNRIIPMAMGKVLGGGSSINAMYWVRGHKSDWDFFAAEAGDEAWNYNSVREIYRRVEDWQGAPDPTYRGTGGLVYVEPTHSTPLSLAVSEGARSLGISTFENLNGRMMEGEGGWSQVELRQRDGRRLSIFRSYTFPYMDRPNLTVLTQAMVTRLIFAGKRVIGVEIAYDGGVHRISAGLEVVLSLGAINTPKVLMQSGIGHEDELRGLGIPLVQHLPGVGKNFQDHFLLFGCVWEHEPGDAAPGGNSCLLWKSDPALDAPDMQCVHLQGARISPGMAKFDPPKNAWTFVPGLIGPKSRGQLHLTGPNPLDTMEIDANFLGDPDDLKAFLRSIELCREIAHCSALRSFVKREVIPGDLKGPDLENLVRESLLTYWHQTCTAKMGRDAMSVVDNELKVYGIENLRIADGSIMPRVTKGNTMAPCVVIGERAAEMLKARHKM
jgi:choline dehydrogenase